MVQYLGIELKLSKDYSVCKRSILYRNEFWKPVSVCPHLYTISSLGRIRSNDRLIEYVSEKNGSHSYIKKGRFLKRFKIAGYLNAGILDKKTKIGTRLIHRMVAINFIPNPENKPEVNHKNRIKDDASISNLEWVTPLENTTHAIKNGAYKLKPDGTKLGDNNIGMKGSSNGMAVLTNQEVIEIRKSNLKSKDLSVIYGITPSSIDRIKRRERWKHI